MQLVLNYKEWRKFENVIDKSKAACENSNINVLDHFVDTNKMVQIGSGAKRSQKDYKLTRYACYLIAQNKELGGTMPEDLPTPKKSLKQLEKDGKKIILIHYLLLTYTYKSSIL